MALGTFFARTKANQQPKGRRPLPKGRAAGTPNRPFVLASLDPRSAPPFEGGDARQHRGLALRELEAAAGLGAAVLLALDGARVAGQEPGLLDDRAQARLVAGQRLGDAVLHCAGLAREPAADDRRNDVILTLALGNAERLVDDQAKRGPGKIDLLLAAVNDDLARPRLQPNARDGVLAAAGRVRAAELVELLLAQRRGFLDRRRSGGRSLGSGRRLRSGRFGSRSGAELVGDRFTSVGHLGAHLVLAVHRRDV